MKLSSSRDSVDDLLRLRNFIREKTPAAAQRISTAIRKGIGQLKAFPHLGVRVARATNPDELRDLIIGNYITRYLIHDNQLLSCAYGITGKFLRRATHHPSYSIESCEN